MKKIVFLLLVIFSVCSISAQYVVQIPSYTSAQNLIQNSSFDITYPDITKIDKWFKNTL